MVLREKEKRETRKNMSSGSVLKELSPHSELIKELAKRELAGQYRGQVLGAVWTFIHPAVMILIYVFLFGIVFRSNIGFANENMPLPYAAYIMSGMVPWLFFQRVLVSGSASILTNATAIKQVIVTPAVYPAKSVYASLILELIYLALLFGYNLIICLTSGLSLSWTYLLLPIVLCIQVLFGFGLTLMLSAVTAYLRDVKDIMQVLSMVCIYLMPVVYLPDAVPQIFQFFLYLNPFSYFIWMFQDVLYFGGILHPYAWIVSVALAILTYLAGQATFQKLKISFGSVL